MTTRDLLKILKNKGLSPKCRRVAGTAWILASDFTRRHRAFVEAVIIGVIAALILLHSPIFPATLAMLALAVSAGAGVVRDCLRSDRDH